MRAPHRLGPPWWQYRPVRTLLSGRCVGVARTKELPFSVAELVSLASRLLTLEPGDVVLGGAPARTDPARAPVRWLRDGDVVEVAIEGLGKLRNHVRGARATPSDSG